MEGCTRSEQHSFMRTERITNGYHECWAALLSRTLKDGVVCLQTKCHQYWPHPPEVKDYGHLRVKCHSEECNLVYVTRQFTLTHTQVRQKVNFHDLTEIELEASPIGEMFWTFEVLFLELKSELWLRGRPPASAFEMQCLSLQGFELAHIPALLQIHTCFRDTRSQSGRCCAAHFHRSHVYGDMRHVCAICHRAALSTGNIHSLPCADSAHTCVGIFLCIYTFGGPPVCFGPGDGSERFTGINQIKRSQVKRWTGK